MRNYYIFFLLSLLTLGCTDFVIEEPITSASDVKVFSDYQGIDKACLGAYSHLYSTSWYGADFILSAELRGGNAKNPTNSDFRSGRYTNQNSWSFNESATSPLWFPAYKAITSCNNVIDAVDFKVAELNETNDADTVLYNNIKAESLFLRALAHFDLVRTYAQPYSYNPESMGVPVVLKNITYNEPARDSVKHVYEQVINDLLLAELLMEEDYARDNVSDAKVVVSVPAIQALLSRVYLMWGSGKNVPIMPHWLLIMKVMPFGILHNIKSHGDKM